MAKGKKEKTKKAVEPKPQVLASKNLRKRTLFLVHDPDSGYVLRLSDSKTPFAYFFGDAQGAERAFKRVGMVKGSEGIGDDVAAFFESDRFKRARSMDMRYRTALREIERIAASSEEEKLIPPPWWERFLKTLVHQEGKSKATVIRRRLNDALEGAWEATVGNANASKISARNRALKGSLKKLGIEVPDDTGQFYNSKSLKGSGRPGKKGRWPASKLRPDEPSEVGEPFGIDSNGDFTNPWAASVYDSIDDVAIAEQFKDKWVEITSGMTKKSWSGAIVQMKRWA